jgi:hypothetical protein
MVLPLSVMSLVQNIKFQIASVATLFFVLTIWIYLFAHHGLDHVVPPVGDNQSTLVGFVLGNFAFVRPPAKTMDSLAKLPFSPDHHNTLLHQWAVPLSLHTQNHYLSDNCLCDFICHYWLDGCLKFQHQLVIQHTRHSRCFEWEQGLDYNSRHTVSSCCPYHICSCLQYCNTVQSGARQPVLQS